MPQGRETVIELDREKAIRKPFRSWPERWSCSAARADAFQKIGWTPHMPAILVSPGRWSGIRK